MMIIALVLLDRRIAGITKGVEVACALLISEVGRVLLRVLRPYVKKAGLCTLLLILTISNSTR